MCKTCPVCGEPISGRIDKKFCSDQCRNSYNNRLNSDRNNYVRQVNNLLRRNRRILEKLNPKGKMVVNKAQLTAKGFNFSYYTNVYITKAGKEYRFCYEHGYLEVENEHYALVTREKYVH